VVQALGRAQSSEPAAQSALETIRAAFGWAYGSYWRLDTSAKVLRFAVESGDAGPEFREVTLSATFAEGVGLSGRAWRAKDLVFVPDIGQLTDCVRAPVAVRAGVRSGVSFPIIERGQVVGTMDFFTSVAAQAQAMTADASVHRLDESSTKIGDVVKVITSIAEQTNLLALNATIEAARAGELGKGFAVAAGEVKELAQSTARATEDVGNLVSAIQTDAGTVVQSLAAIGQIVDRINETHAMISGVLTEQAAVTRDIVQA
jgi:GAF domain-containing protein